MAKCVRDFESCLIGLRLFISDSNSSISFRLSANSKMLQAFPMVMQVLTCMVRPWSVCVTADIIDVIDDVIASNVSEFLEHVSEEFLFLFIGCKFQSNLKKIGLVALHSSTVRSKMVSFCFLISRYLVSS